MNKLPARAGWDWVKQGFALFRKQPLSLSVLFFGYLLFTFWMGLIPLAGKALSFMLIPAFTVAFMQGCLDAEQGKRVHPRLLLAGVRSPAFPALAKLGLVYLGVAALAIAASTLIDGGVLLKVIAHQIEGDSKEVKDSAMGAAFLFMTATQLLGFVMLSFSGPLIYWKHMSVGKAVFYSVFGILKAFKAFLVFGAVWLGISAVIGQVVLLLTGDGAAFSGVLVPLSLIYTIIVFCSFYAMYKRLFGEPETEAPAKAA